jgi:predicted O-methyltransferase YrrM
MPPALLDRIPPDSAAADGARRAMMGARAIGLARAADTSSRALGRALATVATGRLPPEERAWARRIESRRPRVDELALEIADICAFWSVPRIWGRLQMRIVRELRPRTCLELGTAFGMSAAYQAAALELEGVGRVVTLDAEPRVVAIARATLADLGLASRVEQREGAIEDILVNVAAEIAPVDYAFMDAEHTESATVSAFETMLPHLADGAVVVVDDVNLNDEMRRAWESIRGSEAVTRAVGLNRKGVVVVRAGGARR